MFISNTTANLTNGTASVYDHSQQCHNYKLKSFEIASLNLNSLLKHTYELRLRALLSNYFVDTLAINE